MRKPQAESCVFEGCNQEDKKPWARNLCRHHYQKVKKAGQLDAYPKVMLPGQECYANGCTKKERSNGLCGNHYQLWRRHGDPNIKLTAKGSGRMVKEQGYVFVYRPDHPRSNAKGYVSEHRMIMEEVLGRALMPGENVHHINGVRGDNRPENLELWVTMQPTGQRPEDLVEWAYEILARYGDPETQKFIQKRTIPLFRHLRAA